jgi:hypothetical protein
MHVDLGGTRAPPTEVRRLWLAAKKEVLRLGHRRETAEALSEVQPADGTKSEGRFKDQFEGWFDIRSSWKH